MEILSKKENLGDIKTSQQSNDLEGSSSGIRACLMQRDDAGNLKLITFTSSKLTEAQSKWNMIKRDALGKFEVWTYETPIYLYTDHNPLNCPTEGIPKNAQFQR